MTAARTLKTKTPCCGAPVRLPADDWRYERRCTRCGSGWTITRTALPSDKPGVRLDSLEWLKVDDGADGFTGCLERRRNQETGKMVGLYCSAPAGIEDDPDIPWATVCEGHDSPQVVCHDSLTRAREQMADPMGWCEACQYGEDAAEGREPIQPA